MVLIFRDITERRRDEERLRQSVETTRFLADASATLAELTDYESTLQKVASLAVPSFADWCAVDMLEADGSMRRLAVTHADPAKVQLARELFRRYPPAAVGRLRGRQGAAHRRAGVDGRRSPTRCWTTWRRTTEHLQHHPGAGPEVLHLRAAALAVRDARRAHLRHRGVGPQLRREPTCAVAEDLAHRAAIAIENASLLAALKEADRRKDEFLAMLAHELRNPLAPIRNAVQILRRQAADAAGAAAGRRTMIERQVRQMVAAGRRPAGRVAHHPRQDRAAQGAGRAGGGRGQRRRGEPPADRGAAATS